jgi:ribosomal protein L37AE/L43A
MKENQTYILKQKPHKCPACGHSPVAEILYGMPAYSEELMKEEEEGKIVIAGCCISIPNASWECTKCEEQFFSEKKVKKWKEEGFWGSIC